MGTDRVSPIWQSFGNQMRHAREQAGCSVSELATMTSASASLIYKLESGTRAAKRDVAEAVDAALGQDGALVATWAAAHSRVSVPSWTREIAASEERAVEIRSFAPLVLPGLLQTADYARVLLSYGDTGAGLDALVRSRVARLSTLSADLSFVISENALRTPVGSKETMAGQLRYLSEVESVQVQVLPTAAGTAAWIVGPFRLLSHADRAPAAYVEHAAGGTLTADVGEVRRLASVWTELTAWALDPAKSQELIRECARAYE